MSTTMIVIAILVVLYCAFMTLFLIGSAKQNKSYDKKVAKEMKLYKFIDIYGTVYHIYATAYSTEQAIKLFHLYFAKELGDKYNEDFVKPTGLNLPNAIFEVDPLYCERLIYVHFTKLRDLNELQVFTKSQLIS